MPTALQGRSPPACDALAGMGLRFPHFAEFERSSPTVRLLEVHTENLFGLSRQLHQRLAALVQDRQISLHGVGLSLGSADGLDDGHLTKVAEQVRRYQPLLVSEHLAWNRLGGTCVPDLLPLPLTQEALAVVCANVQRTQEVLQRPIGVENISAYFVPAQPEMDEASFMNELARRTGCSLLIDINNLHVNQLNHGLSAEAFIAALQPEYVSQWHLGGPSEVAGAWIDTHASTVPERVWALYQWATLCIGHRPTIVEWDQDLPPLDELVRLAQRAEHTMTTVLETA